MIGLGVLIVIALGALVVGLVIQAKKAGEAVMEDGGAPAVPISGAASVSTISAADLSLLPPTAQIKAVHTAERHLVIRYTVPEKTSDEIAVIELRSGKLLYRIAP